MSLKYPLTFLIYIKYLRFWYVNLLYVLTLLLYVLSLNFHSQALSFLSQGSTPSSPLCSKEFHILNIVHMCKHASLLFFIFFLFYNKARLHGITSDIKMIIFTSINKDCLDTIIKY